MKKMKFILTISGLLLLSTTIIASAFQDDIVNTYVSTKEVQSKKDVDNKRIHIELNNNSRIEQGYYPYENKIIETNYTQIDELTKNPLINEAKTNEYTNQLKREQKNYKIGEVINSINGDASFEVDSYQIGEYMGNKYIILNIEFNNLSGNITNIWSENFTFQMNDVPIKSIDEYLKNYVSSEYPYGTLRKGKKEKEAIYKYFDVEPLGLSSDSIEKGSIIYCLGSIDADYSYNSDYDGYKYDIRCNNFPQSNYGKYLSDKVVFGEKVIKAGDEVINDIYVYNDDAKVLITDNEATDDGGKVIHKKYQLNKTIQNSILEIKLVDYTLSTGDSSNYLTIGCEIRKLTKEIINETFYSFRLKSEGSNEEKNILTNSCLSDFTIKAGETIKGELSYHLPEHNYEGYGFDLIWSYPLENIITNKTELFIKTVEIVKKNDKIINEYNPTEEKKDKEEVINKEETLLVIKDTYYKIGDTVKGDKASFNVINTKEIEDEEGYKYMIVNVEYTNLSKDNQTINFDSFSLNKKNGAYKSDNAYYDKLGIEELSGEVGSGETISGSIIYDITNFAVGWGDTDNPKGKYEFSLSSIPNSIVEF
jgi:hypothetical protein